MIRILLRFKKKEIKRKKHLPGLAPPNLVRRDLPLGRREKGFGGGHQGKSFKIVG
jgi:hypothetical protein